MTDRKDHYSVSSGAKFVNHAKVDEIREIVFKHCADYLVEQNQKCSGIPLEMDPECMPHAMQRTVNR